MSLENELNSVKDTKTDKWLVEPYVGMIQIKKVEISEKVTKKDGTPYTGSPFFKFYFATEFGERSSITFWREVEGGDPTKNENKKAKLKKFLDNCKADDSLQGLAYLESCVSKKLHVLIKRVESWDSKDNGVPRIKSNLVYWFSSDTPIETDLSELIIRLSDQDKKAFEAACVKFNESHGVEESKGALNQAKATDFDNQEEDATSEDSKDSAPQGDDDIPY